MNTNAQEWGFRGTKFTVKSQWWICLAIICAAGAAQGELLFQDAFNYAAGNLPGQGSWTGSGTGTPIQVQNGNLSYAGLASSSGSELFMSGSGASATALLSSTVTSGSVYCSFLMEMSGQPNNLAYNNFFVSFGNSSSAGCELGLYNVGPVITFMFEYGNFGSGYEAPAGPQLSVGSTYLIVLNYNFVPGSNNDSVNLWVDPSSSTFGNATAPTPTQNTSFGYISDPVSSINQFTWLSANTNLVVDELRVGTTWADVTPDLAQAPEPSSWSFAAAGALLLFTMRRWSSGR